MLSNCFQKKKHTFILGGDRLWSEFLVVDGIGEKSKSNKKRKIKTEKSSRKLLIKSYLLVRAPNTSSLKSKQLNLRANSYLNISVCLVSLGKKIFI